MKTNVVSTPLFLRVSAVVFAAAMLVIFVWYSQSRAQTPTAAVMMESGPADEVNYRRWNPLLVSSKTGPVAPPEWVLRRHTEPKARLNEGKSTMAFPMLLDDRANAYVYSSNWRWDEGPAYSRAISRLHHLTFSAHSPFNAGQCSDSHETRHCPAHRASCRLHS
jgi:hypothetical protein